MALSADALTQLTAVEVAAAVAQGEMTPTEVAEAYLARIEALEPRVQAWSHLDPTTVRAEAGELTAEARAGRFRGPLHGVPVGVKDEFHVAGLVTKMAGPQVQSEDATVVVRLRKAGAIIMGKTDMPIDERNPPTRNPWNLEHTPGGSSSGSGAAVAARMVPIALGEQTTGSNIRPAAFCGVDALKPTFGRISRFGCFPFSYSFDHPGIIGLSMVDIALVFSVLAGPDPRDPTARPEPAPPADLEMETMRPPRIGVIRGPFPKPADPEMQGAIQTAADRMRAAGSQVVDVTLPADFKLAWPIHSLAYGVEGMAVRRRIYAETEHPVIETRHLLGSVVPGFYYLQAQRIRRHLWNEVRSAFDGFDGLLTAATTGVAPKGLDYNGDRTMQTPWSCLGYPAITVNGGLSAGGLPLGLQLVGAPMTDYQLLRVGAWTEGVLGRLPAPPVG